MSGSILSPTDFTAAARAMLSRNEGRVPWAYQDSLGFWTIGVGHLVVRRHGGRLPDSIIDALLDYDIQEAASLLDGHLPWWRQEADARRLVAIDLVFNLGWNEAATGGLDDFKNTLAAWQRGDYAAAAMGLRQSQYHKQLPDRSERNAHALETGSFSM